MKKNLREKIKHFKTRLLINNERISEAENIIGKEFYFEAYKAMKLIIETEIKDLELQLSRIK